MIFLLATMLLVSDDPVYVTATVTAKPLASATASVTVIEAETIRAMNPVDMGQLLRQLPGITVTGGGGRGSFATAQIRGGDPNFTLVLLDGVPVNDGTYQVGDAFDLAGIDPGSVRRIEIIRGPLTAFYGSTGLSGVVNIITHPGDGAIDRSVTVAAGDAEHRLVRARTGGDLGRWSWFAHIGGEEERERIAAERFEHGKIGLGLRAALGPRARLQISGRHSDWSALDYPDASGGPVYGDGTTRDSDHRETVLGLKLGLGDRHQLELGHYRHRMDRASPAVFPRVPASEERTDFTRSRLAWRSSVHRSERFTVSTGVDLDVQRGENESLLFLGGPVPGNYSEERATIGAWAEASVRDHRYALELSLRADKPEDMDTRLGPRLGWHVPLNPGLRLHGNLGTAFKLPSFFATSSPAALGGNPELGIETMTGGDLGLELTDGNQRLGITYFHNRYEDLVDFDFQTFRHLNRGEVEARGVETSWQRSTEQLTLRLSATWQDVEDKETGAGLRHRPEWHGGALISWRPARDWRLTADLHGVSERLDEQIPVPDQTEVDGYVLVGLAADWRFMPSWHLGLRADNLAGERYETLIGFPGPGRAWRLRLGYRGGSER